MDVALRIRELEGKVVAACLQCSHRKRWMAGSFQCTVKRSHCHSKRVKKWLDEIDKLEEEENKSGIQPGEAI